ncbi:MAG: N-acetylneuraminate synthase, partial [Deltaproteobacteria bacterium]|nr:N-acetylneuraminate synthase [Deltaproteobacteria bacterium]
QEIDLVARRAGVGISPAERDRLIGRRLKVDKAEGEVIRWEDLREEHS